MIKSLDGIRALAILMVLLSHAGYPVQGKIGVEIFFVVSGFLITRNLISEFSLSEAINFRNFYIRRFARLYPSLLLVTILTLLYLVISDNLVNDWVLGSVGMLTFSTDLIIWLNNLEISKFFNFSWSLGVEEQFYLVWPLVLLFLLNRKTIFSRKLVWAFIFIFMLSQFWRQGHIGNFHSVGALYFGPIAHVGALAGGCLIAFKGFQSFYLSITVRYVKVLKLLNWISIFMLIYLMHYPSPMPFNLDPTSLLTSSIAAIILVSNLTYGENGFLCKLFSLRPLVLIGRLSYTLYLFNILYFHIYNEVFHRTVRDSNVFLSFLSFVVLVFMSYLVYRFYELPFRKRINSKQRFIK